MKPTIIALGKGLGLGVLTLAALLICTALAHGLAPMELWPALVLLFLVYPLAALLLGAASALAGLKAWAPLFVTPALFLVVVAVWYNETALVYVVAYTLAGLAGYAVAHGARHVLRRPS